MTCPCKHLDYDESRHPECRIATVAPHFPNVRYWARPDHMVDNGPGQKPNRYVQFCGQGRGRINGIFQCYEAGEMHCYEPLDAQCGD
jgi:hypothetical protein